MKIKLKYFNAWGEMQDCFIEISSKETLQVLRLQIERVTEIDVDDQQLFIVHNREIKQIQKYEYLSQIKLLNEGVLFVKNSRDQFSVRASQIYQNDSFESTNQNTASTLKKSIHNSFSQRDKNIIYNSFLALQIEQFYEHIQKNYLEEAKILLQSHMEQKEFFLNDTTFFGWSALHVSILAGSDKLFLWLLTEGANINLQTKDGWDCLSLSVCLRQKTIFCLLLAQPKLNVNQLGKHGTALHLAAQNDDTEFVQLLLNHPKIDVNILDKNNCRAIEIARNKTKQLLKYENELKIVQSHRTSFISSMIGISLDNLMKDTFIINKPQRPPILKGKIFKVNYFKLRMYERYMIVDPDTDSIAKFKNIQDIPHNPNQIIPLESVYDIKVSKDEWFQEDDYFYLEIKYFSKHIFIALKSKDAARRWYEGLKNCVGYSRYIKQNIKSPEEQRLAQRAFGLMMAKPNSIINIEDCKVEDHQQSKQKQATQKKKQNSDLNSVSEEVSEIDIIIEKSNSQSIQDKINLSSFQIIEMIGKGSFGNVYKAKYKHINCAIKQQEKDKLIRNGYLKYIISELQILRTIKHPFIVKLYLSFQTQFYLYIVTELCPAGDLSKYMTRGQILNEYTAKFIIAQIILAIEYLHSQQIIYRDLKPENILIDQEGYIKLTDFGLCKQFDGNDFTATSFCGSPAYLPPELVSGGVSLKATDIYQIGTILYEMLTGYPPFYSQDLKSLMEKIKYDSLFIPKNISLEAQDLLKRMLKKDPEERLGYNDVSVLKKHMFFAEIDWDRLYTKQYKPPRLVFYAQHNIFRDGQQINKEDNKILDLDYQEDDERLNFIENWDSSYI
ncbi:unnamed protein product [Paramecium octaurelia]|uniref:Protein kinase domain-containing protein n=1 Tax=Paramecium octaurelia TaxID=43137 RepID=A0A8S1SBC6_PAROT|nr:unnamed protein product [Paramecium octaurelia]